MLELLSSKYSLQNTWQVVLSIWLIINEKILWGNREKPGLLHKGQGTRRRERMGRSPRWGWWGWLRPVGALWKHIEPLCCLMVPRNAPQCAALIINRVVKLSLGDRPTFAFLGTPSSPASSLWGGNSVGKGLGDEALGERCEKRGGSSGTTGTLAGK